MEHGVATFAAAMTMTTIMIMVMTATTMTAALTGTMVATWTIVAIALVVLVVLLYVASRSRRHRVDLEQAVHAFRSLDLEAFRNLVDSDEEAFLRSNLLPKKFRKIKRQRAWAALIYAWEAGKAATALARVGQAAQRSSDPKVAASGIQVAEAAFRLRFQTLAACLHLSTAVLFPELRSPSIPPVVDQYERTVESLFLLGRFPSGMQSFTDAKRATK